MTMRPDLLFLSCWGAWALSWLLAARWSSPAVKRRADGAVWLCWALVGSGMILIAEQPSAWLHIPRLWRIGRDGASVLALLTIPGFLFAWWARIHLGRLWSSGIARKEGHRVIDTGPYAIVRHPIYAGLLEATLVSAVANGRPTAMLGFVLMTLGLWLKARMEERFLARELGADAYEGYRRRVPMLLPFGPVAA